jgi:prolipoprotein diacylglyceryltransferase
MIDFILAKWMAIAIAYGIIYAVYVIYALFALRFERAKQSRRVTESDFYEVLGEAFIGPILLPCRIVKNFFSLIKTAVLGMVNAGLPKEAK